MIFDELNRSNKELLDFCNAHEIILLYGKGVWGKLFYKCLTKQEVNITAAILSDGYTDRKNEIQLPTFHISEVPYEKEKCGIVLATNKNVQHQVQEELIEKGFKNIFLPTQNDISNCYAGEYGVLKEFFDQNRIDFQDPIIDFGQFRISNPCLEDDDIAQAFFFEAPDLILPLKGNYEEVGEGSYEYSKVILKKNDVVIDCGANIGIFSAYAASLGCRVYAFEPTPSTIQILEKTKRLYSDEISIEPYALSNKGGRARLWTNDRCEANSLYNFEDNENDAESIEVALTTVDDFVKQNDIEKVDFIKADIEGSERLMLEGAKETLKRFAPKLSICTYHLPDDKEVLEEIILSANPDYVIEHKWKKLFAYVK